MYTNTMRFTGLSGIDTDTMVKQLMKAEGMKYDKLKKSNQAVTWKQEGYRAVGEVMKNFQKSFLSLTNAANSFRTAANFTSFAGKVTSGGADTGAVKVSVSSSAKAGEHTLKVTQLATKDRYDSAAVGLSTRGGAAISDEALNDAKGEYTFTVDGTTKTVKVAGDGTRATFEQNLQSALDTAFGAGKAHVGVDGNNKLVLSATQGHTVTIAANDAYNKLGFSDVKYKEAISYFSAADTVDVTKLKADDQFTFTVGDKSVTVKIGSADATLLNNGTKKFDDYLTEEINKAANTAYKTTGKEYAKVSTLGNGRLAFEAGADLADVNTSDGSGAGGATAKIFSVTGGADKLGFADGNRIGTVLVERVYDNTSTALSQTDTLDKNAKFAGMAVNGKIEFNINGKDFSFDIAKDSVKSVMDAINNSSAGVNMTYNTLKGTFAIEAKNSGEGNTITTTYPAGSKDIWAELGFSHTESAKDAKFTYDGVETSRSSNTFSIDGVTMTLNSDSVAAGKNEFKIEVNKDNSKAVDMVKKFVDEYNKLLSVLNNELYTKRPKSGSYSYYEPLSDEEKSAMKEGDITLWENKAKTGLLYNDDLIGQLTRDMRNFMTTSVKLDDGTSISLYNIGVQTSSDVRTNPGELVLDEEKLKKALETIGDKVGDLFGKASRYSATDKAHATARLYDEGIGERLNDIIEKYVGTRGKIAERAGMKGTLTEATNTMSKTISANNSKLDSLLTYLQNKENYYYTMFSKMESTITSSNNQMSYLQGMYGG